MIKGENKMSIGRYVEPAAPKLVSCGDEKPGAVQSEMETLVNVVGIVEERVSSLERRLGRILFPASPVAEGTAKEDMLAVPLAQSLRDQSRRLYAIAEFVSDVIKRVEL